MSQDSNGPELIGKEQILRMAVAEFVSQDHTERNLQALANEIIRAEFSSLPESGPIACRSRLGGQLNHYYREV